MSVIGNINPLSSKFHACQDFKKLSAGHKALTIITVAIAALFLLGIGAVPVFRALVKRFTKLEMNGKKNNEKLAKNVNGAAKKRLLNSDSNLNKFKNVTYQTGSAATKQPATTNMDSSGKKLDMNRKNFLRFQLQKQLDVLGLKCLESLETGDCLFDSIAQLLNRLTGGKEYDAVKVREDIANYLKLEHIPHDKYQKLCKGNLDASTYKDFCENIIHPAGGKNIPIWGENLCLQIIADMYEISIQTYSTQSMELTPIEHLDDAYDTFDYIVVPFYNEDHEKEGNNSVICTKLDTKMITPSAGNAKNQVIIAHMGDGPWGHFQPVVPLK